MTDSPLPHIPQTKPRYSATFDPYTISEIQRAAATGIYDIRGGGAKRKVPNFDDLLFLGASVSRYPLEGYRERCGTEVTLGTRFAKKPIHLKTPVTIAGMSFGSLSANAKEALGRGATAAGTSTTTGDGGMTPEERGHSQTLVYQYLPSRYGMNLADLRKADAIEVVIGQGAKPGGGGMLLGQKISARVAQMRNLPEGIDQRSACRHPDWTGPDDLEIKILELRELTNWEKPIYVKVGASRPYYDIALAVKAGADVVVLDGMQGSSSSRAVFEAVPMWRKLWLWVRMRWPSAPQRSLRWAITRRSWRPSTISSAPPRAPMMTGMRGATRLASPPRMPRWRHGSTR
jgi:glutamate synthase domain-containing protein 2